MASFECDYLNKLLEVISLYDGDKLWCAIEELGFKSLLDKMQKVPQQEEYHGEGNVLNHVKLVCQSLVSFDEFKRANDEDKIVLFLSALLHDVGKIKRTRIEDGKIISPGHSARGAIMAREFMWKDLGLSGTTETQRIREAVCTLVKYHSFPPYAIKDDDALVRLLQITALGELTLAFSAYKLYLLAKADVLGRVCADQDEQLEKVELFSILAEEYDCLHKPYAFKDSYTKHAYFLGKTNWPSDSLYNSTWGEVILLSGLPGTGKDTFIAKHFPHMPVVSLDTIRKKLDVAPTEPQGAVVAVAMQKSKEYLRNKQPFLWNATNITAQTRHKLISLFEKYNASVKTIFLETEWSEELDRNLAREDVVPQAEIERMLSKLEIPEPFECEKVEWVIT